MIEYDTYYVYNIDDSEKQDLDCATSKLSWSLVREPKFVSRKLGSKQIRVHAYSSPVRTLTAEQLSLPLKLKSGTGRILGLIISVNIRTDICPDIQ